MSYSLTGDGAEKFSVERWSYTDPETGRVSVYMDAHIRATERLDYQDRRTYELTVHVTDGRDSNGAKDLSIDDLQGHHHHGVG